MFTVFTAAVSLLYSSFPAVPPRLQRCSLPKECGTSPWAGDILFHKVFRPLAHLLALLSSCALKCLLQASRLIHCCNLVSSGRIYRSFKAVRGLGMYLQWHGGSNWLDSSAHVEISLWRVWTSEECFVSRHWSLLPLTLLILRLNGIAMFQTDNLSIRSWHLLCLFV